MRTPGVNPALAEVLAQQLRRAVMFRKHCTEGGAARIFDKVIATRYADLCDLGEAKQAEVIIRNLSEPHTDIAGSDW